MITIRKVTPADADTVAGLSHQLGYPASRSEIELLDNENSINVPQATVSPAKLKWKKEIGNLQVKNQKLRLPGSQLEHAAFQMSSLDRCIESKIQCPKSQISNLKSISPTSNIGHLISIQSKV